MERYPIGRLSKIFKRRDSKMSKIEKAIHEANVNLVLRDKHRSIIRNASGTFLKGSGLMVQVNSIPAAFFKRY